MCLYLDIYIGPVGKLSKVLKAVVVIMVLLQQKHSCRVKGAVTSAEAIDV